MNQVKAQITVAGIAMGLTGVAFHSAKAVMVKLGYQYEVDPISLLLLRMLFSLPFYVAVATYQQVTKPASIKLKDLAMLVLFGILGYYMASYFDFLGLQYISAGQERIILFIYPTIVLLLSRVFLGVTIKRMQVIAICVTYLGVVITFYPQLAGSDVSGNYFTGAGFVFLSALTYAAYLTGSSYLIPRLGATRFTSLAMIVACLSVIIHYLVTSDLDLWQYPKEVYIIGFLMALISTVVPSYLVSSAIKQMGASNFSILGSMGPLFTIILAFFLLGEAFTSIQMVGAVVVIAGVLILSKQKKTV